LTGWPDQKLENQEIFFQNQKPILRVGVGVGEGDAKRRASPSPSPSHSYEVSLLDSTLLTGF